MTKSLVLSSALGIIDAPCGRVSGIRVSNVHNTYYTNGVSLLSVLGGSDQMSVLGEDADRYSGVLVA
jgi:hypothetical protein